MGKVHSLKIDYSLWEDVFYLRKTFDFRKNDRDFKVGDTLIFKAWDDKAKEYVAKYPVMFFTVSYVLHGGVYGIPEGYCIMSIKPQ